MSPERSLSASLVSIAKLGAQHSQTDIPITLAMPLHAADADVDHAVASNSMLKYCHCCETDRKADVLCVQEDDDKHHRRKMGKYKGDWYCGTCEHWVHANMNKC